MMQNKCIISPFHI